MQMLDDTKVLYSTCTLQTVRPVSEAEKAASTGKIYINYICELKYL